MKSTPSKSKAAARNKPEAEGALGESDVEFSPSGDDEDDDFDDVSSVKPTSARGKSASSGSVTSGSITSGSEEALSRGEPQRATLYQNRSRKIRFVVGSAV
jgi:hypothetical protein